MYKRQVFETVDGKDLSTMSIPALYTYEGFNGFFLDQLAAVAAKLENEQWVMGDQAAAVDVSGQLARLGPQLLTRYREDYLAAWDGAVSYTHLDVYKRQICNCWQMARQARGN